MSDTNYIGTIVKILEKPKNKTIENNISITEVRAQLPKIRTRKNGIIKLIFWGKLAVDFQEYYKTNDYIMIEGYLSVQTKPISNLMKQNLKKVEVTVFKVYPFLLKDHSHN
jgi:single-stranded DNA-binding protein